ncbi:MAG: TIGR02300 family protein [Proteobacteria bacterium]|nr:TIGR02300 family protein [Pseudomonadota bacterium]
MAKAEWGVKRACLSCGIRFYDMQKSPIVCPSCETTFEPEAIFRPRRNRPAEANTPAPANDDVVKKAKVVDDDDDDEVAALISDVVVDDDDDEDDDVLAPDLDDDDDDDDDVAVIPVPKPGMSDDT